MSYKIYLLENSVNDKVYVGVTKYNDYINRSGINGEGYKSCGKLWSAIQEIGWINFKHSTIDEADSMEEADRLEAFYIDLFDSVDNGYNTRKSGYKKSIPKKRAIIKLPNKATPEQVIAFKMYKSLLKRLYG